MTDAAAPVSLGGGGGGCGAECSDTNLMLFCTILSPDIVFFVILTNLQTFALQMWYIRK